MAKAKTEYICQNCGVHSPKWLGKCPSCNEWNTFVEELVVGKNKKDFLSTQSDSWTGSGESIPKLLSEVEVKDEERWSSHNQEFDRVLGGGIVPGSLVLIGGEPGIGKSTLTLQIALGLKNLKTLYVSGEESIRQIKMRAERVGQQSDNCFFLSETSVENVFLQIKKIEPDLLIIDSIQTLHTEKVESSPGSVTQVRESTNLILQFAKKTATPVFIIGHINKDGNIAGPKILEHIVDTVLQFEGDQHYMYRILRATKNRFGSTSEIGIFEMLSNGLREVSNPSEMLLSEIEENLSGVAVSASIEGVRPFLIEIQALVSSAAYGTPQRSSMGFDLRRLSMLLAVLEKRAGFRLGTKDVFLNIAGGLKVDDTAVDLGVLCSILSSDLDIAIPRGSCFAGEVGLSGEIRSVNRIDQRISEAQKLGFKRIYISKYNRKVISNRQSKIEIIEVGKVEEVFARLFDD